jgi:3-oxoacyl-[acyl-carrier protein] reductase
MDCDLPGKVALVTGASRGIGKGIALELAAAGCDLMLTGRDADALARVADEIAARGRKAAVHVADLTADGEPEGLAQSVARDLGRLDILVNSAGAVKRGSFFDLTEKDWSDGFGLKLFAHVRLCRLAWPGLSSSPPADRSCSSQASARARRLPTI